MQHQIHYRPEVDGLRAIAVTGVVLYHAEFSVQGGYVGVDVFFVISGFLITSLILRALEKGTFTLAEFWVRRIRRIFPASIFMLGGVLVLASALLFPRDFERLAKSAISQCAFSANVYFYRNADYFNTSSELLPLLHTWSLAVEEQFYFIYPLLLVGLWRLGRNRLFASLLILGSASLALSALATERHPDAAFYLLPFRAWELLAGGILAALPSKPWFSRAADEILSWGGLLSIVYAMAFFNANTVFPGISAGLPVLGSVLIILSNSHRLTTAGRLLATKPFVFVGLISYSWYLWHWPLMAFMRYSQFRFDRTSGTVAMAASFVIAVLSWKFIERPFRHPLPGQKFRHVFAFAATASCVIFLAAAGIIASHGIPGRFTEQTRDFIASTALPTELQTKREDLIDAHLPTLGRISHTGQKPSFLLWGDSHALFVAPVIQDLADEFGVYGYIAARSSTTPVLGAWSATTKAHAERWNESVLQLIERNSIRNVILAGRWTSCIEPTSDGNMRGILTDDATKTTSRDDGLRVFESSLKRTVNELSRRNIQVWLVNEVPLQECEVAKPIVVQSRWEIGGNIVDEWHGVSLEHSKAFQERLSEVLERVHGASLVDSTSQIFADNGQSRIAGDGQCYYFDDDHLSAAGARRLLTPACRNMFQEMFGEQVAGRPR